LRHGSQLIAFRARFVGGRPSVLCSPEVPGVGEVLPRTTPAVDALDCFVREAGVCKDEGGFGSDIVKGGREVGSFVRIENVFCNINKQRKYQVQQFQGSYVGAGVGVNQKKTFNYLFIYR